MSTQGRLSIAKLSEKVYRVVVILLPVVVLTPYQDANEVFQSESSWPGF